MKTLLLKFVNSNPHTKQENAERRHKLPLLRRLSQRLGVRVLSKTYRLETKEPFALEDIAGVSPVVKVLLYAVEPKRLHVHAYTGAVCI